MGSKSENTKQYILEKVSPLFNQKGYVGTSLSEICAVTKLTKGSIYGNFENKEDLALHAFKHNIRKIIHPLNDKIAEKHNSIDKLLCISAYYRNYYQLSQSIGGCPVLNVGVDAKNLNPQLFEAAKEVAGKLINGITNIIYVGQQKGEIKAEADARLTARNIYSIIEGGIFTAMTSEDESFLLDLLNHIDKKIILALKKEENEKDT